MKAFVSSARVFFVPGTMASDYLQSFGASKDAIFRVANTPDIKRWREVGEQFRHEKTRIKSEFGLPDAPILLTVGRLIPEKGVDDLIRAFGLFHPVQPEWHLVIVGDGPHRHILEELVRARRIGNVHFLLRQKEESVQRLLGVSEIFCVASRRETWGVVVNEALAAGIPTIVTRKVGAAPDLVLETGAGVVVPERDPVALARAIEALARDPREREKMSQAAWSSVKAFSYEESVHEFLKGCEFALRQRPSSRT